MPTTRDSIFLALVCSGSLLHATAAPHRPASDDEVVEQLPRGASLLAKRKTTNAPSLTIAREYFRLGQLHSEPRYVRHAESLLESMAPGPERSLMQGLAQQYFHQFDAAQNHFVEGLKATPRHAEILLQLAMLHTVRGRYQAARETLSLNTSLLGTIRGMTVLSTISSLNGQLTQSFRFLEEQFSRSTLSPSEGAWVASTLAEMAVRQGQLRVAEEYLNRARALEPESIPLLIQAADLLIEQKRYREALALTKASADENLMVLLRRAIALKQTSAAQDEFKRVKEDLGIRLADSSHLRERAMFQFFVLEDHNSALQFALENFNQQREPIDARLVLEAARKAGTPKAEPVLQWLAETKLEDASINSLLPFFKKGS
jgi:predicted Zn-dependent protease